MGLPGQYVVRTVVPMFPLSDPRNKGGPAGLAGDYEVTFTFNRPGYPLQPEQSIVSGDQLERDSHLGIPEATLVHEGAVTLHAVATSAPPVIDLLLEQHGARSWIRTCAHTEHPIDRA